MKYQNLLLFDNYKNVGNPILISKNVFKISDPSTRRWELLWSDLYLFYLVFISILIKYELWMFVENRIKLWRSKITVSKTVSNNKGKL